MGLFECILSFLVLLTFIMAVPMMDRYKRGIIVLFSSFGISSSMMYFYYVLLMIVILLFSESVMDVRHLRNVQPIDIHYYMKLHKSYVTGFIILLAIVLKRFSDLLKSESRLKVSDEALQRQAKGASAAVEKFMNDNKELEEENKKLKQATLRINGDSLSADGNEMKVIKKFGELEKKLDSRNAEIKKLEGIVKDLTKSKKKTEAEKAEAVKLANKYKEKTEDYEIMMDSKSKKE